MFSPGKFHRTSCFCDQTYRCINTSRWMNDGFQWVRFHAGSWIWAENNRKRSKSGRVVLIILWFMSGRKQAGSWQGWLRWSDRIIWGECRQKKGCGTIWCVYSKKAEDRTCSNAKTTKTSKFKLIQTKQNKQKTTARNDQKQQQQKWNNSKRTS